MIRRGMRGGGAVLVFLGFLVLGGYGIVVNLLQLDFSKLLGAYVGFFAVVSVLAGRLVFGDTVPSSTWVGLGVRCTSAAGDSSDVLAASGNRKLSP